MSVNKLLAAAITATTFSTVAAAADVTVYGKANVTLNQYDIEQLGATTQDNWKMESNASRLGVKGSIPVNDSLKVIYKMEYETYIDDGDKSGNTFSQRNIYGGLQGNFGTVIAGKNDTPTKLAQGKVDKFNDLPLADIKNVFVGENRASNIIMYTTPTMSGFSVTAAIMPGEDNGTGSDDDDGLADYISAAVTYTQDNIYIALASDSDVSGNDVVRLVGEYSFSDFKIGLMYQNAEEADTAMGLDDDGDYEEQTGYLLSGAWSINSNWAVKAQYAFAENTRIDNGDDDETTSMSVGADYKLNKQSKVFAYYSNVTTEQSGSTDLYDGSTFAVGYELKF
ncbi:MAG: porin [Spongiibacteraceae bacterium]